MPNQTLICFYNTLILHMIGSNARYTHNFFIKTLNAVEDIESNTQNIEALGNDDPII